MSHPENQQEDQNPASPNGIIGKEQSRLGGFLAKLATLAYRFPGKTLLLLLVFSVTAIWASKRLSINADFAALLPKDMPSVIGLDRMLDVFGGHSYVAVVASGTDAQHLKQFADDVEKKLKVLPHVLYVQHRRPVEFFQRYGLYYLDLDALSDLTEQIEDRKEWEVARANPFFVSLEEEEEPPQVDYKDLIKERGVGGSETWFKKLLSEPYQMDERTQQLVVLVKPQGKFLDLSFAKEMVANVTKALGTMDFAKYGKNFTVKLGGGYTKKMEQQARIQDDLALSSMLAIILVLMYLAWHFRRMGAVALVFMPLLVGIVWTYGVTAALFGVLNILTAFVAVILLGMGIDHGVHLLGRFEHEWYLTEHPLHALQKTYRHTGRAVIIAALTTMAGFGALTLSDFRAFHEFGVVAGIGVAMVVVAYSTLFPALLSLFVRFGWKPKEPSHEKYDTRFYERVLKHAVIILIAFVLVSIITISNVSQVGLNHNSRQWSGRLPSYDLDFTIDRLLGHSQSPVVVIAEDEQQEEQMARILRKWKKDNNATTTINFISALADLEPSNQDKKLLLIRHIREMLATLDLSTLPQIERNILQAVMAGDEPKPFTFDELPEEIIRRFRNVDGKIKERVLFLYASVDLSDGLMCRKLTNEIKALNEKSAINIQAIGAPMIQSDILDMIEEQTPLIGLLAFLLVFITMALLMRSFRDALICQSVAILTLFISVGVMGLAGIQFNYINAVIVAVIFGMSVDAAVHLVTRVKLEGLSVEVLTEVGRAITGAIFTTALGFGAMELAWHPGLTSLADVALICLAVNMLVSLLLLPSVLKFIYSHKKV